MARLLSGAILIAALAIAAPAVVQAHHGWGEYNTTAEKLSGVITSVSYSNPHASIRLKSGDKEYLIVLAPPSRMTSRGLPDGALKTGQQVSIDGYVHKTNPGELRAERITVENKTAELR